METILVVDDEVSAQESFKMILKEKYNVLIASSAEEAIEILNNDRVDLVLLDIIMPGLSGLEVLRMIQQQSQNVETIVVSASQTLQTAIDAMKMGAADYIVKPFDVNELRIVVKKTIKTKKLKSEVKYLRKQVDLTSNYKEIVGNSVDIQNVREKVKQVADSTATVLITGESGTGKELVARRIHFDGQKRDNPFVPIHCAAIPETLLESELFGHEKGAFTGATFMKKGKFEIADTGTLFMDEIGEMSPHTQAKLLRVLEQSEFQRVGGNKTVQVDVRIIASTNRDLYKEIEKGSFREDLFYRLNVVPIHLSPLRKRREDIPLLVDYFLKHFREELNSNVREVSDAAMEELIRYNWLGNVRELKNIIERIMVLHPGISVIEKEHLPNDIIARPVDEVFDVSYYLGKRSLKEAIDDFEKLMIEKALSQTRGVQTKASKLLGTTRRILRYKMKQLGIRS